MVQRCMGKGKLLQIGQNDVWKIFSQTGGPGVACCNPNYYTHFGCTWPVQCAFTFQTVFILWLSDANLSVCCPYGHQTS